METRASAFVTVASPLYFRKPTQRQAHNPVTKVGLSLPSTNRAQPTIKGLLSSIAATAVISITLLSLGATQDPAFASCGLLIGRARVIDGDTLIVASTRVRLYALDAPELKQTCAIHDRIIPCGIESRDALRTLVDRVGEISCSPLSGRAGVDPFGRTVAICHAGAVDVGDYLVRHGHAFAYTKFGNMYVNSENEARANRR